MRAGYAAPEGPLVKNRAFYRALSKRGQTTSSLAQAIRSCRSHVCEVFNNKPGHGGHSTRKKLAPLLTEQELGFLGWDSAGRIVPRDTQSSNAIPEPKRLGP